MVSGAGFQTKFENEHLDDVVNAIQNGHSYWILIHSSSVECMEEYYCGIILNWLLHESHTSKPFMVTSNYSPVSTLTQSNLVILTDFSTSIETRHTLKQQDHEALLKNVWVIPIKTNHHQSIEDISTILESYSSIQLNTQIYILAIDEQLESMTVFEVYKIPGLQGLITATVSLTDFKPIWTRRSDLMGVTVRMAFMDEPPVIFRTTKMNKTALLGPHGTFMSLLQSHLNFTVEFIEPEDQVFGTYSSVDNSSSGIVKLLIDNKADIVGNQMYQNYPRSQVMSFVSLGRRNIRQALFLNSILHSFLFMCGDPISLGHKYFFFKCAVQK